MNPSRLLKSFAFRSFFQFLFFSTLLFAVLAGFYWQVQYTGMPLTIQAYVSIFLFMLFFGILQWMFLKNSLSKLLAGQSEPPAPQKTASSAPRQRQADIDRRKNQDKRLFVHLFAVLQRKGRLMDFLKEDLAHYEDAQIGAAVRNIHENCRKTVEHYLSPEPVMSENEGQRVDIPDGFDPQTVKLVGNVVGQPPFSGILRHRGWQLRDLQMPELSDTENPNIIAPAEVEVL